MGTRRTRLPTGRRNTGAMTGDSRRQISTDTNQVNNIGPAYWTMMEMNGVVRFPHSLNFGVNGDTTLDVANRLGAVKVAFPGFSNILCSTNDRAVYPASVSINKLRRIVQEHVDAGILPIITAEMPRGDTAFPARRFSSAALVEHYKVRDAIYRMAGTPGVEVLDPWPLMAVPNSVTGDAIPGLMRDGLHPGQPGSQIEGRLNAAILRKYFDVTAHRLLLSGDDAYSAISNPTGALNANPMMTGTGGTPGTGVTGQLATSWTTTAAPAGVSVTLSKVLVRSRITQQTEEWQRVTLSGTPTEASPNFDLYSAIPLASLVLNDLIEANGELSVSNSNGFLGVLFGTRITYSGGVPTTFKETGGISTGDFVPPLAFAGYHEVPNAVVAGTAASARVHLSLAMQQNVPISVTVDLRATAARKAP